jgi:hypothetical protein
MEPLGVVGLSDLLVLEPLRVGMKLRRAKLPMKSTKYPFVIGRRRSASAFMLSESSGSNSTLPHEASMPFGRLARCGILVIRGDAPILREYLECRRRVRLLQKILVLDNG